ncbi:MAG: hypothetical protein U9Q29_04430 [Campylobacterota bacterium]|nr:hypothetical protein [Campylobacterota bacterium]
MTIEAKLFPKIALLEQDIKQSSSKLLKITIVANEMDFNAAEYFKRKIELNYPNEIREKLIIVNISKFKPSTMQNPDVIIVLSHQPKEQRTIALWANQNKIVSFAYDSSDLNYGILSSIYIGKSVKPYLNRKIIKEYNFIFDSYLLQLSKFTN